MKTYFIIFGNHPQLSLAEFTLALEGKGRVFDLVLFQGDFLVFRSDVIIEDFVKMFDELGGAIKCGTVHKFCSKDDLLVHTEKFLKEFFVEKQKCYFGISFYGLSKDSKKTWQRNSYKFGMGLKKTLQKAHDRVRFVVGKHIDLSSVIVKKNKLISDNGAEVVCISDANSFHIGRTLTVQRFDLFGERDYGRPHRDDKSGMLPPKLARIMIHLSGTSKEVVIGDLFCGSGTVLQEALVIGYQKVFGSDVSEKAMSDTKRNLSWLKQKQDFSFSQNLSDFEQIQKPSVYLQHVPVQQLPSILPKSFFDAVISEPYLGDSGITRFSHQSFVKEFSSLISLYQEMFRSFEKVLKKNGRLVIILPFFRKGRDLKYIPTSVISSSFSTAPLHPSIQVNDRGAFEYARENQGVGREIWVLDKK